MDTRIFGLVLTLVGALVCLWALTRFVFFARIVNFWPPLPEYESTTIGISIIGAAILFVGYMYFPERI